MKIPVRLLLILTMTSFVAGCTGSMVRVIDVDDLHVVSSSFTKEQVKEAIMEGAESAGWLAKDLGGDSILATYHIRTHTIQVRIDFINSNYSTQYSSSNGMKMFCSERDKQKNRLKVSGRQECIGTGVPSYIHGKYKKWVDSLNTAIQNSLANI